ncbi:hypothetical protein GCM10028822_27010 [Hymenobacter terrigena]
MVEAAKKRGGAGGLFCSHLTGGGPLARRFVMRREGFMSGAKVCCPEERFVVRPEGLLSGRKVCGPEAFGGRLEGRFVVRKRLAGVPKRLAGVRKRLASVRKQLAGVRMRRFVVRKRLASVRKPLAEIRPGGADSRWI